MSRYLRTGAATFEVACGLVALITSGFAVGFWLEPMDADLAEVVTYASIVVGGIVLFIIWAAARVKQRWLHVLTLITGALAVGMFLITVLLARPSLYSPQLGWWAGVWIAASSVVLWILVTFAALLERRHLSGLGDDQQQIWRLLAAVAAPLALVTLLVLIMVLAVPHWMIRSNSHTSAPVPAAPGRAATLSGGERWTTELAAGETALPTPSGLAVPVAGHGTSSAGVAMIDPITGRTRWRYELRGAIQPPELRPTADGRQVVVSFDEQELGDGTAVQTFTVAADSGRVQAFWPDDVVVTDPPARFDHVARGTNAVIRISTSGRRLWTYRPQRCADPRGVASTPTVVIVPARECGHSYDELQLLGLDARTGERRWVQPNDSDSEDGPTQVVVRPGFQVESSGGALQRRQLDSGEVSWSVPAPGGCADPEAGPTPVASERTIFVIDCEGEHLTAFAVESGEELWHRRLELPITALVAVDDQRVLALSAADRTCRADLLDRRQSTTLVSRDQVDRSGVEDPRPGSVRCDSSAVHRVGEAFVLQLQVADHLGAPGDTQLYRFVGLA
jgi:outer membrane protein assembly factor BamB/multisubunit Na+/H+ antiporter MnhB subunit